MKFFFGVRCMCLSSLIVCFCICVCDSLGWWRWSGCFRWCMIVWKGFRDVNGFWNIICMLEWYCFSVCFLVLDLMLLSRIFLFVGVFSFISIWVIVDFFDFDFFISVIVLFVLIVNDMFFMVCSMFVWKFDCSEKFFIRFWVFSVVVLVVVFIVVFIGFFFGLYWCV